MDTREIEIPREVEGKWQEIVDILAALLGLPAALIMRVEPPEIVVFVTSESSGNPYEPHERACLDGTLYCETVIRTRQPLLITDASSDERWRLSPDLALGMISYLGFPITWPDGSAFGTICLLDRKKNTFGELCQRLMRQFRDVAEADLRSLVRLAARLEEEARTKQTLREQVADRTAELAKANERLRRDIADRKRVEEALRESQQLLQAVVDDSTVIIFAKDLEGRYLLVSRQFERSFQVRREDALGKTDLALFPKESADAYRAFDQQVMAAGKAMAAEEEAMLADGLHTFLSIKVPLCDEAGTPRGVCGISTDITERKQLEQDRLRLLWQEQEARAAAEAAVRMRDEFLVIASHELNTPVTSLQLVLQSLSRRASESASSSAKMLCLAERQVLRLAKLVEVMLDVSKIQTGQLTLTLEEVDVPALCREVVASLEAELSCARSAVIWHGEGPVVVTCDRGRMRQVVTHLLSNAVKYGAGKPVEVRVEAVNGKARLAITDHGSGIAPDVLLRIFGRFERGVSWQHYGGFGLGLYITRVIVEAHGGSIHIESEPGVGSVFTVEIPGQPPHASRTFDGGEDHRRSTVMNGQA